MPSRYSKVEHTTDLDRVNILLKSEWEIVTTKIDQLNNAEGFTQTITYSLGKIMQYEDLPR